MEINVKTIGSVLIGFSIILLFLLVFLKVDNDSKSADLCDKYQELDLDMQECPVHKNTFSWAIIVAFGVGFIMLVIGIYLLLMPKLSSESTKKEFKHFDINKLDEQEKNIYNILKNKGGSVYQLDLIKGTGFSKVKISRILDKMESMGILERKRRGMTNIIVLK